MRKHSVTTDLEYIPNQTDPFDSTTMTRSTRSTSLKVASVPKSSKSGIKSATRKKNSPSRIVAKALANTKSIFHYFSPSPSKKKKDNKQSEHSEEVEVVEVKKVKSVFTKTQTIAGGPVTTESPTTRTDSTPLKRKNPPSALSSLNSNLMRGKEAIAVKKSKASPADSPTAKKIDGSAASRKKRNIPHHDRDRDDKKTDISGAKSDVDSPVKVVKPSSINMMPTSFTERIKVIANAKSQSSTTLQEPSNQASTGPDTPSSPLSNVKNNMNMNMNMNMALIHVRNTTTNLQEICRNLCIDPSQSSKQVESDLLYHLHEDAILGRNEPKVKKSKISLGIPKSESGISRAHILVESVNPANNIESKKDSSIKYDDSSSHSHLCRYLKDAQVCSSSVTVCNKGNNAVLVCKARISGDILKGHISRLDKGFSIILKVGDAIVFDAYNYKRVVGSSEEEAVITAGCQYVYRLASVLEEGAENKMGSKNKKHEQGDEQWMHLSARKDQADALTKGREENTLPVKREIATPTNKLKAVTLVGTEALEKEANVPVALTEQKHHAAQDTSETSESAILETKKEIQTEPKEQGEEEAPCNVSCVNTMEPLKNKNNARRSSRIASVNRSESVSIDAFPNVTPKVHDDDDDGGNPDAMYNPFVAVFNNSPTHDEESMNLELSQDSFLDFSFQGDSSNTNGPLISEMYPALANSCWRALNSTEIHNGFGVLTHLESSWNVVPNDNLAESLSHFLMHGPKKEGTKIREPHRTEMSFLYLNKIISKPGLDRQKHQIGLQQEVSLESFLAMPMNETKPFVNGNTSESQSYRLSQALQFCSNSLNFVAKSITVEMEDIISGKVEPTTKILSDMQFAPLFLKNNARQSLKMIVRYAMKFLLCHGHWLAGSPGEQNWVCKTSHEQKCAKESKMCANAYGAILSHVAWLFCASENIPFGDHSCCYLINDVINAELAVVDFKSLTIKKKLSAKNRDKYKKDMKIRFLFSLTTNFSSNLQIELASHLNLSTEAMLIL